MTLLTEVPPLHGSHCAGIGCEHDELAGSGLEPPAPSARATARHRAAVTGRRARVVSLQPVDAQHAHDRNALLG